VSSLVRGRVYRARPTGFNDDKFFVVVSNNSRNRQLDSVLVALHDVSQARAAKHRRDPFRTMAAVGNGLRAALGLD